MNFFKSKKKTENVASEAMIQARAHALMTLWIAERLDKSSEQAANYADLTVESGDSDELFLEKALNDLLANGQHLDMEELQERLDGFKTIAKLEFEDEDKFQ